MISKRAAHKRLGFIITHAASAVTSAGDSVVETALRRTSWDDYCHLRVLGKVLGVFEEHYNFSLARSLIIPAYNREPIIHTELPTLSSWKMNEADTLRTQLTELLAHDVPHSALKALGLPLHVTDMNAYFGRILHILGVKREQVWVDLGGWKGHAQRINVRAYLELMDEIRSAINILLRKARRSHSLWVSSDEVSAMHPLSEQRYRLLRLRAETAMRSALEYATRRAYENVELV